MKTIKELRQDRIDYFKSVISSSQNELVSLEKEAKEKENITGIEKWLGYDFESSSGLTEEYSLFAKELKKYIIEKTKNDFDLIGWNRGHFEVSGFLKNKKNSQFVYFSCSDIRYFRNAWYDNLLVRTAENEKDYTGGSNDYIDLPRLNERALYLIR